MTVDVAALGALLLVLLGGRSPVREHGTGRMLCVVSVKAAVPTVTVIQQDSSGRMLPFGTWHYGQTLCADWAFTETRGRLGYVVANDTTWGAPL